MLLRKLVVVGLVGLVNLVAQSAMAQEVGASPSAIEGVSFADSSADSSGDRINFAISSGEENRFSALAPTAWRERENRNNDTSYELSLTARAAPGIDVAVAQRGRLGYDSSGAVASESRSSELRLGRGLGSERNMPSSEPRWYFFAASEDEALIWRPGQQRNAFGGSSPGFALQDRVEIGDIQAGVTYEVYGIQASLAYVQREISVRTASRTFSQDEAFAGLTITLRH